MESRKDEQNNNNINLQCLAPWLQKDESMYNHSLHIDKKSENDISKISTTLNSLTDIVFSWVKRTERHQVVNQNYVEKKLDCIEFNLNKVDQKISQLETVTNLDLKEETKQQIENLLNKIDNQNPEQTGMNNPGDNKIPRLYYGSEEIKALQTEEFNYTEYINVREILDYWKHLYKDPILTVSERNKLIEQIQTTYLENEKLLQHYQYELNQYSSDEEEIPPHVVNTIDGKRKAEDPLQEFQNWEAFEDYMQTPAYKNEKEDFVKTGNASTSNTKNEDEPNPFFLRRDNLNKQNISQHGIYLDLRHVPFKDQEQTINEWAQSMYILITNYKSTWSKKKF